MPPVTRVIRAGANDVGGEIIRALHTELAVVGLPVSGPEVSGTPHFEAATESRVREFQNLYRLAETGEVDPATGGVMTIAALVASEPDRTVLRQKLRDAAAAGPDAPEFKTWVARSALLAGDYGLAHESSPHLVDLSGLGIHLGDLLLSMDEGPGSPREPEVPFPENFYSYRHDVMAQQAIDTLRTKRSVPSGDVQKEKLADSAEAWLRAIEAWQQGNANAERQRYDGAVAAYDRCQEAALDYFASYPGYAFAYLDGPLLSARMDELLRRLMTNQQSWTAIGNQITWRRQLLSLAELSEFDGRVITAGDPVYRGDIVYQLLFGNLTGTDQPPPPTNPIGPEHRKILMDTRLLVIAAVLVPLARAEANRLRRQYAAARDDLSRFLRRSIPLPNTPLTLSVWLACEFIEIPFARLQLVETMLDQAEAQYKARASVDNEPTDATRTAYLARLAELAQDFNDRQIPGDAEGNSSNPFQHLTAALTYADVLDAVASDGDYVARTRQSLDILHANVTSTVANGDVTSLRFRSIGHGVTVPTVTGLGGDSAGLTSGTHPHEPYLQFNAPNGQPVMRERNPRVYALLLQAQSRLLQIWSGFNYLGYRDDYVPPWRFSYLLDRARYFSEHAKNAQRDYLNFLSNAENQEFKELSAGQNVELEKANVQIETARVDQAAKEVATSVESRDLADMNASDAQQRMSNYQSFSSYADTLMDTKEDWEAVVGVSTALHAKFFGFGLGSFGDMLDGIATGVGDFFSGGAVSRRKEARVAHAQREMELKNLELAAKEANQASVVAQAQLQVAKAGLVVAGLQRQAALLRHEFSLQNLQFMRNQILNTEQWYRIAGAIRSVGDTYLRYAIETAFLAQQAYNFEADKRLVTIRFDYDLSDVGAMLAADFLLRDLDSLEQDLVVSQQTRLQQVRYVLSLAREFPDTLRALADQGEVMFSMRLEQLERRFPGMVNLRISSVDLQPVALMDPTRMSVQLTHLGTGMVRLKAQPGGSALNTTDLAADGDWLSNVSADWPVKIRVSGPSTEIFSGLSRQEASSPGMITANERGAFEGLPGASSWRIDMSMKENRVVPDSLADVLVTFTLSGYYDVSLRDTVERAPRRPFANTSWFSGHQLFADAFYQFNRTGRMDWQITSDFLALQGSLGELQNVAVVCAPSQRRPELGRLMCSYPVEFEVDATGTVRTLRELPFLALATNGLVLSATLPIGPSVTFDFGDGTGLADQSALPYTYARPGRYEVVIRIAANSRLTEYRAVVVVSRLHTVLPPCIATPVIPPQLTGTAGLFKLQPELQSAPGDDLSVSWRIDNLKPDAVTGPVTFTLRPGRYVLRFAAARPLMARFYSQQRYVPTAMLQFEGLRLATNRVFDMATGTETTASLNDFGQQVFGTGSGAAFSPTDRWTLELPLGDNPSVVSVGSNDVKQHDVSELADALLALEYTTKND